MCVEREVELGNELMRVGDENVEIRRISKAKATKKREKIIKKPKIDYGDD